MRQNSQEKWLPAEIINPRYDFTDNNNDTSNFTKSRKYFTNHNTGI